jgi:hypothetical protein
MNIRNFCRLFFIWMGIMLMVTACNFTSDTLTSTTAETPILTPTATAIPSLDETVNYLHLRVEFTSSSDWAVLELLSPENLLAVNKVSTLGTLKNSRIAGNTIGITQTIESAQSGASVGFVMDYAFHKDTEVLEFKLEKGNLNDCQIKFFSLAGDEITLLTTINHDNNIPNSQGLNPYPFSLVLSEFPDIQINSKVISRLQVPKMVWAFYYPWWSLEHWESEILLDHPETLYASNDPEAIKRQIEQAQKAGIDGFISSWWGPNSTDTDPNLQILLDEAQKGGFSISIYFETLAEDGPLSEASIYDWLSYAIRSYGDHPAFYKINGSPLIVLWSSQAVPNETWQRIFTRLEGQGLHAYYLGLGFEDTNLDVFDGYHLYGVFPYPDLEQVFTTAEKSAHYYQLLNDGKISKFFAATVQPGYDDRLIPDREGQQQDREGGDYYRRTFEAALLSNPDWIFITSWNEWWEHTHIEPSTTWGDLYLQITLEYSNMWKSEP